MTNCKEYILDDVMAITAIPIADFDISASLWQLTPTIANGDFYPNISNAITVGLQKAKIGSSIADALIPIRRTTGKAKDDESDSVAGRIHTVNVSCEVDDRSGDEWTDLLNLERTPAHLLLSFRDSTRAFVSASYDTYTCDVARNGAKTTVSFRIQNIRGIQLIV